MPLSLPERQEVDKAKADIELLAAKLENQKRLQEMTKKALTDLRASKLASLLKEEIL